MKVVVVANQKGGVGKTTTAQNLAVGVAMLGKRVLVLDVDHQANLTSGFGVSSEGRATLIDVLRGIATWKDAAVPVAGFENGGGCVLIPGSHQLAALPALFADEHGKEMILREALEKLPSGSFDLVLLDSPPSLDLIAVNSYVAATDVLVPVQCEAYALRGLALVVSDIERITKRLNPSIRIEGVLGTMYDGRKRLSRDVLGIIRDGYPAQLYKAVIRDSVAIAEAPSHGKNIFDYDPKGYGAQDYAALSAEFCDRNGLEVPHGEA